MAPQQQPSLTRQRLLGRDPEQRVADLTWVMSNESGRRLMLWIIYDVCGLEHVVFDATIMGIKDGEAERVHGWHKDGARKVGHDLKNLLGVVPTKLRRAMSDEAFDQLELVEAKNTQWATDNPDDRA